MRDLITSLSTRFINATPEEIDGLVQYTLQEAGKRLKADRCMLLIYSGNQRSYEAIYEWLRPGLPPFKDHIVRLSSESQRWSLSQLKRGEVMEINQLSDLPEEARLERELYQQADLGSMLLAPLVINNALVGLLGLAVQCSQVEEARRWQPNELVWLHSLTEMLTSVLARERANKLQDATYQIAQASFAAQNLDELYAKIHQILGRLMPVDNFFLALYDRDKNILEFPYFVDQFDPSPTPQRPGHGLTEYVLRTGKPLWAPEEVFNHLIECGEVDLIGEPSLDWVGVPLIVKERTIGVMAAQCYTEGLRFGEYELNILTFVSTQVAMVIERKLAEQQLQQALNDKEILLREVHRRVRNNMQVVSSLISLQAEDVSEERYRRLFSQVQNRIRAMAGVHEELYRSQDFGHIQFDEYIENLAHTVYLAYCSNPNVVMHVEVEPLVFTLETATPCGLIVHELLSNALEHAFPEGRAGNVWVRMNLLEDGNCRLMISDDGVGLSSDPEQYATARPFGLQLVEILSKQIHSTLVTHNLVIEKEQSDFPKSGTTVELVFMAPTSQADEKNKFPGSHWQGKDH